MKGCRFLTVIYALPFQTRQIELNQVREGTFTCWPHGTKNIIIIPIFFIVAKAHWLSDDFENDTTAFSPHIQSLIKIAIWSFLPLLWYDKQ